jgi:hypothetical protein
MCKEVLFIFFLFRIKIVVYWTLGNTYMLKETLDLVIQRFLLESLPYAAINIRVEVGARHTLLLVTPGPQC